MNCPFHKEIELQKYDEKVQFAECPRIDLGGRCKQENGTGIKCSMMYHRMLPSIAREGNIGRAKKLALEKGINWVDCLPREWGDPQLGEREQNYRLEVVPK